MSKRLGMLTPGHNRVMGIEAADGGSAGWPERVAREVYEGRRSDEGEDLEFKRHLGWTAGDRVTIARSILGFANRPHVGSAPAVLLVGVEPGQLDEGREWIDSASVRQKLAKYLGEGLRWMVTNVQVHGRWVQAFVVESPQWGDPIYPLRAAGTTGVASTSDDEETASRGKFAKQETYQAGAIFVRHGSVTGGPTPEDVERLTQRATGGNRYLRDAGVSLLAGTAHTISDVPLGEILQQEKDDLLASLDRPLENPVVRSILGGERRSPDRYRQEVDTYLHKLGVALPEVVRWWMAERPPIQFQVHNHSQEFREATKLVVQIAAPCRVITDRTGAPTPPPTLPKAPRPFGSDSAAFGSFPGYNIPESLLRAPALYDPWDPSVYERGGVTYVEFPAEELRPEGHIEPRAIGLQVFTPGTLLVSWSLTAKCAGRLRGEIEVPVEVHDPGEALAALSGELQARASG